VLYGVIKRKIGQVEFEVISLMASCRTLRRGALLETRQVVVLIKIIIRFTE
jgi:hypothetical protein